MLHLAAETRPTWITEAMGALDLILLDHAHCEKKAASQALNLIFRYGDDAGLAEPLAALAQEELAHFRLVLGLLEARGLAYGRLEPSPYAERLLKSVRRAEPDRKLDLLLCSALIEARSCERMKLLSENLPDPELAQFYKSLLASEARHFSTYVDLAAERFGRAAVVARLDVLAQAEAAALAEPGPAPRMHA